MIKKLKSRLEDAGPFTDPLEDSAFHYGFSSKRLEEVLSYWKGNYLSKWSERQDLLNQFSQFKTQIQGLNIHFLHVKPKVNKDTKVFPLLVSRTRLFSLDSIKLTFDLLRIVSSFTAGRALSGSFTRSFQS